MQFYYFMLESLKISSIPIRFVFIVSKYKKIDVLSNKRMYSVYLGITRSTFIDVHKLNFNWVLSKGGSGHLAVY